MATWVEDIVQALRNLGGQAHRKQIFEEIKRIRKEQLPEKLEQTVQRVIQDHSSDSAGFRGVDLFRKVGNGVWALRENVADNSNQTVFSVQDHFFAEIYLGKRKNDNMSTWVEDIVQALKNLGGQATNAQICQEVKRIRKGPFPKRWAGIVNHVMGEYCSDSVLYRGGEDIFRKMGGGTWALRDYAESNGGAMITLREDEAGTWALRDYAESNHAPKPLRERRHSHSFQNFITPESLDEITNILRTIKEYRDFRSPDNSSWIEYIKEFFQILGFATEQINPRLYSLDVLGSNHIPEAILLVLHPGENFEEMVPGLPWDSYCFLAAKYYKAKWGIISNGIQLKVMCYDDTEKIDPLYWRDLDGVICNEQIDTFCSIYKVFSFIKMQKGKVRGESDSEDLANRHILRLKFWEQLLEKANKRTYLHTRVKPGKENWISAGAGKPGLVYSYVVRMEDAQVELYIDNGEFNWNKKVFNLLLQHKSEIENLFGGPLDWQLLPEKRASRIRYVISDYGLMDEDHWDELQNRLIDAMVKMENAFQPIIAKEIKSPAEEALEDLLNF